MDLESILKLLKEDFETIEELFGKDDWLFYRFGNGGPYKRTLTKIMEKSKKYDQIIFDYFGANEETASFNKLIVLGLSAAKKSKERHKNIDTFRRQIQRMGKIL
ncbi:MAG: hypothetical protein ACTSWD_11670 [Candidatus Heimdallarchaeota archaeon]